MKFRRPEELGPCRECGGPRAMFEYSTEGPMYAQNLCLIFKLGFFELRKPRLYACTCLWCGTTTLRPDPDDMEEIREAAEKQFKR